MWTHAKNLVLKPEVCTGRLSSRNSPSDVAHVRVVCVQEAPGIQFPQPAVNRLGIVTDALSDRIGPVK